MYVDDVLSTNNRDAIALRKYWRRVPLSDLQPKIRRPGEGQSLPIGYSAV